MSLQNFNTVDLHKMFILTLERCFSWNCSDERIKFLCVCTFNMKKAEFKLEKKVQARISKLSREKSIRATLCSRKKISLKLKRLPVASPTGLRLLKVILPSVPNHLESWHDIKHSLKEFILITNDEYCFLKNETKQKQTSGVSRQTKTEKSLLRYQLHCRIQTLQMTRLK